MAALHQKLLLHKELAGLGVENRGRTRFQRGIDGKDQHNGKHIIGDRMMLNVLAVMAGLDPAIHGFAAQNVDARAFAAPKGPSAPAGGTSPGMTE
ncbi:hypothetical protein [Bradyrhizobium sp. RDM4]|uniref:hypothetical protein n=1 Tax=Bradyrhizobium sp. RDM4 TaxID=3378765 RepID=UPI0038FCFEE0